jgi:tRNA-specific 2-thiouridylase
VSWVAGVAERDATPLEVRIRHKHRPAPARVFHDAGSRVRVLFDVAQDGVSPGQAAVFYRGDEVVGGAWIARTIEREENAACA